MTSPIEAVASHLLTLDPRGERLGRVLRNTWDQLYDGVNTARFRPDQLRKTEKTHCGSLLEILLQRDFGLQDGSKMDYSIAGFEVDCKFSMTKGRWMLPRESVGHISLLITSDEYDSSWHGGLLRIEESWLNPSRNQDSKRTLNAAGRDAITWLWSGARYPENTLLHLTEEDLAAVFGAGGGAKRVAELFRRTEGRPVWRGVVATVARQLDYMRRVRVGGGARDFLGDEGYVVFGGHKPGHRDALQALSLPPAGPGELVAVRLTPASAGFTGPSAVDETGRRWRRASYSDEPSDVMAAFGDV